MFNKDMLNKLQAMKQQADESKDRMEALEVSEEAGGGLVRVVLNGNRKILSVEINAELNTLEKEDLEDLLVVAISKAMNKVNEINEKEVMSSAQSLFPWNVIMTKEELRIHYMEKRMTLSPKKLEDISESICHTAIQ